MRLIVDMPKEKVEILNQLSKNKKTSRAAIIRQALTSYISNYNNTIKGYESAFAIWKDKNINSLTYQKKLREEWDK